MTAAPARVLYIHGFNSSPASEKAQSLLRFCNERFPALPISAPRLGSSLGGCYATWLAEKYRGVRPRSKLSNKGL